MQTIPAVLAAIFLGFFGLARPFVNCSAHDGERRQAMPYSVSTLLLRNLNDVFGENDPVRRRAAILETVLKPEQIARARQRASSLLLERERQLSAKAFAQ